MKKKYRIMQRKNKSPETVVDKNGKTVFAIRVNYAKPSKTIQSVSLKKSNVPCSLSELLERRQKNVNAYKRMKLY